VQVSDDFLASLGETRKMRMTVRLILALTLDEFGIALHEWETRKRAKSRTARSIARAGQLAAWLAHRNTSASTMQIGNAIGRDNTTVLHALKRMPEILASEGDIARAADRLEDRIEQLAMLPEDSAEARALLPDARRGADTVLDRAEPLPTTGGKGSRGLSRESKPGSTA
jgi:hypothetical protein